MIIRKWQRKIIIPFLAPALFLYLVFFLYPATQSFWVSLTEWSGFGKTWEFIGIANFKEAFKDTTFFKVICNTLGILVLGGFLTFTLSFILTGIVIWTKTLKNFYRIVIFAPNVVATVVLGTLWGFIYNPSFGLLNSLLKAIGLTGLGKTAWLGPDLAYWSVLFGAVWLYVSFYAIFFIAGSQKIPESFYEAAQIEGAGKLRMFFSIVFPLMWDVITVGIIFWMIDAFMQFEFYFIISGSNPPVRLWTISVYIYKLAFSTAKGSFRMGYATALSVFLLAFVMVFTTVIRKVLQMKESHEY